METKYAERLLIECIIHCLIMLTFEEVIKTYWLRTCAPESDSPRFKFWLPYILSLWSHHNNIPSINLTFLTCDMEKMNALRHSHDFVRMSSFVLFLFLEPAKCFIYIVCGRRGLAVAVPVMIDCLQWWQMLDFLILPRLCSFSIPPSQILAFCTLNIYSPFNFALKVYLLSECCSVPPQYSPLFSHKIRIRDVLLNVLLAL